MFVRVGVEKAILVVIVKSKRVCFSHRGKKKNESCTLRSKRQMSSDCIVLWTIDPDNNMNQASSQNWFSVTVLALGRLYVASYEPDLDLKHWLLSVQPVSGQHQQP